MKIQHFIYCLAVIAVLFTACKKDYRDKWVGNWNFVTVVKVVLPIDQEPVPNDTIYYLGKISCGADTDKLVIKYRENDELIAKVDENGSLLDCTASFFITNGNGGFIGTDSITIGLWSGGAHFGTSYHIDGTKKKGGKSQ